MSAKTGIEWTDATWNPIRGCSRVSEGCRNCYAEGVANRFKGDGMPYEGLIAKNGAWNGKIKLVPELLGQPIKWKKPRRIFVNSMSDLFHESVPFEFIASVFSVMAVTTRHTYQILTKRPQRMLDFFEWALDEHEIDDFLADDKISDHWPKHVPWSGYDNCGPVFPYKNVWLGVSVEDQKTAEERIPLLLKTPAAVRWISAEPLIGSVDLLPAYLPCPNSVGGLFMDTYTGAYECCSQCDYTGISDEIGIDWVVAGGESGKDARPSHPDWYRSLRDQCADTGVPFFFKQWGEWREPLESEPYNTAFGRAQRIPAFIVATDGTVHCFHNEQTGDAGKVMLRVAKKKAGRLLDGVTHDAFPVVAE